jgi:hypothetical protein
MGIDLSSYFGAITLAAIVTQAAPAPALDRVLIASAAADRAFLLFEMLALTRRRQ